MYISSGDIHGKLSLDYLNLLWYVEQRCQPGSTHICKIMTKNLYNLQKNPYKLSTPLQNTNLV